MTALVRNLPALTRLDVLRPLADATRDVTARLTDRDALRAARVHPLALLVASRTYGRGSLGARVERSGRRCRRSRRRWSRPACWRSTTWSRSPSVSTLRWTCRGSMGWSHVAGLSNLTAREAAAAMAMVIARHAERHVIKGFSAAGGTDRSFGRWASRTAMQALPITGSSTLREAVEGHERPAVRWNRLRVADAGRTGAGGSRRTPSSCSPTTRRGRVGCTRARRCACTGAKRVFRRGSWSWG